MYGVRKTFARFVVLGDSTAEGFGDPGPDGRWRGFGDRLAERLGPDVAYRKLAVSGYVTRQIHDGQLAAALAHRPDLAAIMAGMNDLLRPRFDTAPIAAHLGDMYGSLAAAGATVIAFTVPEVGHRLAPPPFARPLSRRMRALNDTIRRAAAQHGARLIDLATHPMAGDPRMWSADRLHGNPDSHARLTEACAEVLDLPGASPAWRDPLPTPAPRETAAMHVAWARDYMLPWLGRKLRLTIRS